MIRTITLISGDGTIITVDINGTGDAVLIKKQHNYNSDVKSLVLTISEFAAVITTVQTLIVQKQPRQLAMPFVSPN
jgi:hypothetical protein